MKDIFRILPVLVMLAALGAQGSDPVREKGTTSGNIPEDPENLSVEPVVYQHENGEFQVVFPGGCGKLITRANEPDLFGGQEWDEIVQVTHVFCDRWQKEGEGCFVMATFNLHKADGTMAGPQNVVIGIEGVLEEYGVKVVKQQVIQKDFGNGYLAEGVDVFARPEQGPGEFWARGLLINGDVYILAAWNQEGGLWKSAEYAAFFNSFQPWTE
jgi:hypothetical protein